MTLHRATTYLKNVVTKKEIIPFRRFMGGVGRHAQVNTLERLSSRFALFELF
jgi:large subunit ribosomal protein L17e